MDGGKNWSVINVSTVDYNVEGAGFIDSLKGWTGGDSYTYETNDGGATWIIIPACPGMNRVYRVNDTLLLASGNRIWKYKPGGKPPAPPTDVQYTSVKCAPNPAKGQLNIEVSLSRATHEMLLLFDGAGRKLKVISNTDRQKGIYKYSVGASHLPAGTYYLVLKTHEEKQAKMVAVMQ